ESLPFDIEAFREAFAPIAVEFSMTWRITDSAQTKRVGLMASGESHCLADLLHRWHTDELDCEIPCVISTHDGLRSMAEWHVIPCVISNNDDLSWSVAWHGSPVFHVPAETKDKAPALAEVSRLADADAQHDVVLAQAMQVPATRLREA